MEEPKFTEEKIKILKDIFKKVDKLDENLLKGEISDEDYISKLKELKFVIREGDEEKTIFDVHYRNKFKDETEEEFKERVIGKLNELGIKTISMRKST